ncbi:MAG: methyltransferase domain-containing protein [Anaerolineae bacterium]
MQNAEHFFDFAAQVGLTKHLGGAGATEELLALCHIGPDSYVLDVGCGAGVTPAFIVHKFGCRVVGVDILEGMVQRSRERAAREGIAANTEFRVADAQDLPFDDEVFDAVITESVSAFPEDKQRAVDEYARVTRPGGYVGLNESTWLQVPPPPEMVDWVSQEVGAAVSPLTPEEWRALMEGADLRDIVVQVREISTQNELQGLLRRYGCRGMLGVWGRILALYARNPAYRQFVRQVQQRGVIPENLDDYFGYGLYVGRK